MTEEAGQTNVCYAFFCLPEWDIYGKKGLFEHKDVCHFIIYEIEPCGIFFTEGTKVK